MTVRPPALVLAVALAAVLSLCAAPAFASLGDEVAAGNAVAARVQDGTATCRDLSDAQLEHLGEAVMERMAGSRAAHAAMNARMTGALGAPRAERMHELIGRTFAGCPTGAAMGPGMMAGGGWRMMAGSGWGWMHDGAWRHMGGGDWQALAARMMGDRAPGSGHHGWSPAAVAAVGLGAILLAGLAVLLVVRRPWRRPPAAHAA